MTQTEHCIQTLADAFGKGICPRSLYVESLQSLVRLAISEHLSGPILAAKGDIEQVEAIRRSVMK